MAQHGAHVTQTLQPKPSIFEVVAADSLQATFYPALKRIVNVSLLLMHQTIRFILNKIDTSQYLACLKPGRFGWMLRYYDELFLCLHGLLQQHYLRTYGNAIRNNSENNIIT